MIRKLKAWLVLNRLTDDPNDFTAVVDSNGSVGIEDVIDELVAEGMELKRETVLDVISRFQRKSIDLALGGYVVNTGLVVMRAVIRGVFTGKTWDKERNRLHISLTQGSELRKAVNETAVEILGEHADLIALFGVTDLSNGQTDSSLTRGFNAELRGTYIRIAGDDPTAGVWLRNLESGDDLRLPDVNIVINDPSRLLLLIPAGIPAGEYELRVTTQYSHGGKTIKSPRTAILHSPVTIA